MSEQSAASVPDDDGTTLSAGVPGPSGTGELTDAGADPAAPAAAPPDPASPETTAQPKEQV